MAVAGLTDSQVDRLFDEFTLRLGPIFTGPSNLRDRSITSRKLAGTLNSPTYVAGVSGWNLNMDGVVEFQEATINGTITAGAGSDVDWSFISNVAIVNADVVNMAVDKLISGTITSQTVDIAGGAGGYIQSSNYIAATAGWRIDGNGDAEFNSATIRGDLVAGTIALGTNAFNVDSTGNMWLGAATFATAPFRVANNGRLDVGGTDATSFHIDSTGRHWAGHNDFASAPFKVTNTGDATAETFIGDLITLTASWGDGGSISSVSENNALDIEIVPATSSSGRLRFRAADAGAIETAISVEGHDTSAGTIAMNWPTDFADAVTVAAGTVLALDVGTSRDTAAVALIHNDSTNSNADGLTIQLGIASNPGASNKFIRFLDGSGTEVGSIQGDGTGGVTLV